EVDIVFDEPHFLLIFVAVLGDEYRLLQGDREAVDQLGESWQIFALADTEVKVVTAIAFGTLGLPGIRHKATPFPADVTSLGAMGSCTRSALSRRWCRKFWSSWTSYVLKGYDPPRMMGGLG